LQQATTVTAFPAAVFKKFQDDGASRLAALISYWGFFALFPLLLALVSILGFVLEGNPDFQAEVVDSTVGQIPVIGDQLSRDVTSLRGSGTALAIGIVGAIWAGLGVTLAIGNALDELWAVPRVDRPDFVSSRLRGLAVLAVVGTATVASTRRHPRSQRDDPAAAGRHRELLGFGRRRLLRLPRSLPHAHHREREHETGAARGRGRDAGMAGLQTLGGLYVEHVLARSSETYGVFAVVIGLLSWLWLAAQLTLVAAEVNVVLDQRLWPRSLFGGLVAADERAMRRAAEAARRDKREEIVVRFGRDQEPPARSR
jgi:membrane protein